MKKKSICAVLLLFVMLLNFAFAEDMLLPPELTQAETTEEPAEEPAASAEKPADEAVEASEPLADEDAQEPRKTARIRAVGDLMASRHQLKLAKRSGGKYDYAPQFQFVKDALANADFTIGNLETPVNPNSKYTESDFPNFNTPPEYLDTLVDCGVDFVSLANNHMNDNNFEGLAATIQQVEKHGILHAGAYANADDLNKATVAEVNGIRIGFLSYTTVINRKPKSKYAKSIATPSNRNIIDDVQALRDQNADIIICMMHWGIEKDTQPSASQKKLAEAILAAGVDIIIGHHPHVLQPVEVKTIERDGESRKVMVAWSLGNFIGNMRSRNTQSSVILDFTIVKENGKTTFRDIGYIPIYTVNRTDYLMTLLAGDFLEAKPSKMTNDDYQDLLSTYQKTVKIMGSDYARLRY